MLKLCLLPLIVDAQINSKAIVSYYMKLLRCYAKIIDYYFVIMYLKIDLNMNGLDVSVMSLIESNDVLEASQY